jgi:hypothetical protein
VGVLAISCGLLFFQLGFYPLWCDEADTALFARGIARTGDAYAVLDHNVYAFGYGKQLVNLRQRFFPPLSFYFAAPFVGREGTSRFGPRLPFAVCGLLTIGLMLYWLYRDGADAMFWMLFSLGIVTNVSLMLYFRQCRYNALTTLLTVGAAYCYLHWNGRRWMLALLSLLAVFLLSTQYLQHAAVCTAVGLDYALFERRRHRLTARDWCILLVPQIVIGIILVSVWNPMNKEVFMPSAGNILVERLTLFWRNFRDLNTCEYGVGLLMLAAPVLYFFDKNIWLVRGTLAIVSYTAIATILSPYPVSLNSVSEIRYLSAIIPLCIFLTALSIWTLSRHKWAIALPLALLAFGTNVLNCPLDVGNWRSTPYKWIKELYVGRPTPTQTAIDWIDANVQPGQSIFVSPEYMTYPLMYHAPQAVYAWQLKPPPEGQFRELPPIHFAFATPPDYLLCFGRRPYPVEILKRYGQQKIEYRLVKTLGIFWADRTRPELFLRRFEPVVGYDPAIQDVYVWKHIADGRTKN